jgi:hypothetical protein
MHDESGRCPSALHTYRRSEHGRVAPCDGSGAVNTIFEIRSRTFVTSYDVDNLAELLYELEKLSAPAALHTRR